MSANLHHFCPAGKSVGQPVLSAFSGQDTEHPQMAFNFIYSSPKRTFFFLFCGTTIRTKCPVLHKKSDKQIEHVDVSQRMYLVISGNSLSALWGGLNITFTGAITECYSDKKAVVKSAECKHAAKKMVQKGN